MSVGDYVVTTTNVRFQKYWSGEMRDRWMPVGTLCKVSDTTRHGDAAVATLVCDPSWVSPVLYEGEGIRMASPLEQLADAAE